MGKPNRVSTVIVLERAMIESPAFRDLSARGIIVLMDFLGKRKIAKDKHKKRSGSIHIVNNGEITYTYSEAQQKGIPRPAFARAIDDVVDHGFVDIAATGEGLYRSQTFYSISDRWKQWGTERFIEKARRKRRRRAENIGFQKGHPHYSRKSR